MDSLTRQIYQAIQDFNFGNYSLDNVEEVKGEEWQTDLAKFIASQVSTTNNAVIGQNTGRVIQANDIRGGVNFG